MRTYFIVDRVKQVYDFLVVELHELGHDFKFGNEAARFLSLLDAVLDSAEKVLDGAGNDSDLFLGHLNVESWTHCVGFSRAGLPVRQDRGVVSIRIYLLSGCFFLY